MVFRHWCGECDHKTAWLSQSESELAQIDHYAKHHPGIAASGIVEWSLRAPSGGRGRPRGGTVKADRSGSSAGIGCLPLLGILVLFLFLAASCQR